MSVGVGIGGTPAAERLEIINSGTDTAPALRITNDAQSWNLATRGDVSDNFIIRDVTGGVNALTIAKSTGNVGIGTSSPGSVLWTSTKNLHISDATAAGLFLTNTTNALEFNLACDSGGGVYFDVHDSTDGNDNFFAFRTEDTGGANTPTERLRINKDGEVGIGTSSPSSGFKLDVNGKAIIRDDLNLYNDYCIQYWKKANGTDNLGWILNRDDNTCQYMWADGQPLLFGTTTTGGSTTERVRITSTGSVGIGTSSPNIGTWGKTITLDSGGAASTSCALELSKSGTLYGFFGVQGSGSSNALDIAAYQSQDIRLRVGSSAGTTAMTVSSAGNVGIGTMASPSHRLSVYEGGGSTIAGLFKTNQTDSFISFQGSGTSASSTVRIGANGDDLNAYVGGAYRLTVLGSNGNVGIVNTSPTERLDVNGNILARGNLIAQSASSVEANITSTASTANVTIQAGEANVATLQLKSDDGDDSSDVTVLEQGNGGPFKIKPNNGSLTAVAIDSSGQVGVNRSNPSYALDVDGIVNCTSLRFADGTSISTTPTGTVLLRDLNPAAFNYDMHVAGKVGIGTTSPDHSLEIDGGSGTQLLHLNSNAPILKVTATNNSSGLRVNTVGQSSGQLFRLQDNGTTRFCLEAGTGSVGIGTTSPAQRLEVSRSSNGGVIPICVSNRDNTAGTNQKVSIGFGLSRNTGTFKDEAGKIQVGRELDWSAADTNIDAFMSFYTYTNNTATEKMRIKANGNVGIGTSSPAFKTEIVGDTLAIHDGAGEGSGRILFDEQSDGTYGFSTGYVGVNSKSFDGVAGGYPTNTFFIARHNNSKSLTNVLMSNRDNGHIGIGSGWGSGSSAYPNSFLHSKGPERLGNNARGSATKLGLIVEDTGGAANDRITGMVEIEYNATGKTTSRICTRSSNSGSKMLFLTSNNYSSGLNSQPLCLNYNGRIAINSESPNATLAIYNDTNFHNTNDVRLYRSTNHSTWCEWKYDSGTCQFGTIGSDHLSLMTNNNSRIYLASNGQVGINNTAPSYTLDVNGTVRCNTLIFKDGTSFSSVGAVGMKAIAVNIGNGSSNVAGRAKSVIDASYGGIENGMVLVYYYYHYHSRCGNGGCTRTAYAKQAYQVTDGNWVGIFGF